MIKHIVMFKFRPEVDKEKCQKVLDELRDLPQLIKEIREFEVFKD